MNCARDKQTIQTRKQLGDGIMVANKYLVNSFNEIRTKRHGLKFNFLSAVTKRERS